MLSSKTIRTVAVLLLLVTMAGCAAQKAYRRAEREAKRENWDKAVIAYSKAVAQDPGNVRYAVALERAKLKASSQHFEKGKRYFNAGQLELAIAEYQQTLLLNPGNEYARNELDKARRELLRRQNGRSELERMKERAAQLELAPPKLDPTGDIPILLNFRETEIGKIYEAMSKASGINFIFDDKVDDKTPMTIDIGNVTMEKALDILMLQTKSFYKVIDEHTLLIAPDTRPKRQEYEDQVIRTFYLSNGDTKQVVTLLRSLLQSRQIAENTDLNSVTIKDTPDKVAIAQRIIDSNDKSKGEVLIDVELVEINRTLVKTLGLDLSSKALSLTFLSGAESLALNNLDIVKQQGNWSIGPVPSVLLDFLKSDSESRSIAKPQLRVTEGEKAEILIGDRVPIPTTSFNSSQTIGGNIVPITSFTYQNVGITLQIEPRVHHNKEVTLNVQVEISAISSFVETQGGQSQPIIGTRNIQTVIRLRDGETNVLAGLIRQEDSETLSGIPGLMDIPGLGKALSGRDTRQTETDIILTLTPHIIRIPDITEKDLTTLWVGTEENMKLRGAAKNALGASPFARAGEEDEEPATPAEADAPDARRRSGSVSTTTSSPEVERDRAQSAAERERSGRPDAPGTRPPAGAQTPGGRPSPPPRTTPDASDDADPATPDEAAEDDPAAGPALVQLVPSQPSYSVGETVVVQVFIEGASNVGSVPFHLRYNRQVLEPLDEGAEGPFLGADGVSTVFLSRDAGGEIIVGMSRVGGGEGASGAGVLATFQFTAVNPGPCSFAFSAASVKDPRAANLPASFVTQQVQVQP